MFFFSNALGDFHKGYKTIFPMDDQDGTEEGEGPAEESGTTETSTGDRQLILLSIVDEVAETTRDSWSKVFDYEIAYFFNVVVFARWKAEREKKQAEEWRRKH